MSNKIITSLANITAFPRDSCFNLCCLHKEALVNVKFLVLAKNSETVYFKKGETRGRENF